MRPKIRCDGESCKFFGNLKELNTAKMQLRTTLMTCPAQLQKSYSDAPNININAPGEQV
jgi:hypothetical protein